MICRLTLRGESICGIAAQAGSSKHRLSTARSPRRGIAARLGTVPATAYAQDGDLPDRWHSDKTLQLDGEDLPGNWRGRCSSFQQVGR